MMKVITMQSPHDANGKLGLEGFERGLMQWKYDHRVSIDCFFPVRFWFVASISLLYAIYLLFWSESIAVSLLPAGQNPGTLKGFLYFRGWFLTSVLFLVTLSYVRDKYVGLVSFVALCIGCTFFVMDLFAIFEHVLRNPTPTLFLLYFVRSLCLWMIFLNIRNLSRMPPPGQRFDLLLPFRRR